MTTELLPHLKYTAQIIRGTLGYHSITRWRMFQIWKFLFIEMRLPIWSTTEQNWPRRKGNNHMTRDSRNHDKKQSDDRDMNLSQNCDYSFNHIEMTHRGFDPHVPEWTLYNASTCFWQAYGVSQDRYPARPQPGRWWAPGVSWVGLEATECVDPWCSRGAQWVQVQVTCWPINCVNALIL